MENTEEYAATSVLPRLLGPHRCHSAEIQRFFEASNCRQRIVLDALTPKRAAAARQLNPPSIAATTLLRRSCESVRAIHAGLLSPARSLNHICTPGGIPRNSFRPENALKYVLMWYLLDVLYAANETARRLLPKRYGMVAGAGFEPATFRL